jgi:hypothetical protein
MLRTTVGVSFLVLFGVLNACSSKDTTGNNGGGGNGTVLTGGSGGTSSGGTSSGGTSSGGTNANTVGGGAVGGSTVGRAGATSTAGSSSGLCADDTITCVDTAQAMGCNPNTGIVETINCAERLGTLGFTSTGCSATAEGEGCDITDFKDAACLAGAEAYRFCANAPDEEFFDLYIACFLDEMGAHELVTCLGDYVSETMTTDADCQNAADACLQGAGGAGSGDGAGGAGGAP